MTEAWKEDAPGFGPEAQKVEQQWDTKVLNNSIAENGPDGKGCTHGKVASIADLPSVAAYLKRVGAEVTSMFRAKVWDHSGQYPNALAKIIFERDGAIKPIAWSGDLADIAPTDAESAAIAAEITGAKFLEPVPLHHLNDLNRAMREAEQANDGRPWPKYLFEFRDPSGKRILMVQTRKDIGTEKKIYQEWTHWESIGWQLQAPDALPLWGLEQLREHSTVFIHEGAGAAARCRWMAEGRTEEARKARAAHPWGASLSGAAHVGWVGGALSPWRTDWAALGKAGVQRAYIVADNDDAGRDAVKPIARALAEVGVPAVHWVRFDDTFPVKFDLANDMPAGARSLREYTRPATWATREIPQLPAQGRGRPPAPQFALRPEFAAQWAVVNTEGKPLFVERETGRKFSEESFNSRVRPFSDVRTTADLLKKEVGAFDGVAYRPGDPRCEISEGAANMLNVWRKPVLVGDESGDPSPWLEYLAHLIPGETDRHHVCRWLATLIARPDIRMGYGLLLFSRMQGTGKSTMGVVLRRLLGEENVAFPQERDVVGSDQNDWVAEKALVFVHEIYAGGSWKAYNSLKTYVTDSEVRVNKKFVPQYTVENWAHFILCSNHSRALSINKMDRRWLVPEVTEKRRDGRLWMEFHQWLAGDGPAIIRRWAREFVAEHRPVEPHHEPPVTDRKRKLAEDSMKEWEKALRDLAEAAHELASKEGKPVALMDKAVLGWVTQTWSNEKGVSMASCFDHLVEAGMHEAPRTNVEGRGGNKRGFVVTCPELAAEFNAQKARDHMRAPGDVLPPDF